MRRFYILPKSVWESKIKVGEDGDIGEDIMLDIRYLFHPQFGSHYLELDDGMILMVTNLSHSEWAEDTFHLHPEVAILPHPSTDGKMTMKEHITRSPESGHKFQQKHLDLLSKRFGIVETDNLFDVVKKVKHPMFIIRNIL